MVKKYLVQVKYSRLSKPVLFATDIDDLKVGDQVYFAKFGGQEVTLDGEKFLLICERDIFAVVTKD